MGAAAAGTVALGGRSRRWQAAFAALALLAAFARIQLAVLAPCYAVAVLVVGARRRALGEAVRLHAPVGAAFALPALLVLLVSPGRVLGAYTLTEHLDLSPALVERLAHNALGLMYASGWILVPGAIVGAAVAIARPRSDLELGFGALAASVAVGVLVQAALWGDPEMIQERYVFYAVPLVALCFALCVARGWPRRSHALVAAATLLLPLAVPLSGFALAESVSHSPFLFGVFRLQQELGVGGAALTVALVATVLSAAAIALSLVPRPGGVAALAIASAACVAVSVSSTTLDVENSGNVREAFLPAERSWVDAAEVGETTLLYAAGMRTDTHLQLFWNRSVTALVLLPGAEPPDGFHAVQGAIAPDGELLAGGEPLSGPVLADQWGIFTRLHAAELVASSPTHDLWRPSGSARLSLVVFGWYPDRWLGVQGAIGVWPEEREGDLAGRLTLKLGLPDGRTQPVTLRLVGEAEAERAHVVRPGEVAPLVVPVCGRGRWSVQFATDGGLEDGQRVVALRADPPEWRPDPAACP